MLKRVKKRAARKSLAHCTHFLARHHIAHSTPFTQLYLINACLVVQENCKFSLKLPRNAVCPSRGVMVDFIKTLGTLVKQSVLNRLQKTSVFSVKNSSGWQYCRNGF